LNSELESYCRERISSNANLLVPWWIMAAWTYEQGLDFISDGLFDEIAVRLDREWETIAHQHKHLLDRALLKSALAIGGNWPNLAIGTATKLLRSGPTLQPPIMPLPAPSAQQIEEQGSLF